MMNNLRRFKKKLFLFGLFSLYWNKKLTVNGFRVDSNAGFCNILIAFGHPLNLVGYTDAREKLYNYMSPFFHIQWFAFITWTFIDPESHKKPQNITCRVFITKQLIACCCCFVDVVVFFEVINDFTSCLRWSLNMLKSQNLHYSDTNTQLNMK